MNLGKMFIVPSTKPRKALSEITTAEPYFVIQEKMDGSTTVKYHVNLIDLLDKAFLSDTQDFLSIEQDRFMDIFYKKADEVTNKIPFEMLFVDEAQFLSSNDIKELTTYADVYNIDVYCYGLKNDSTGRMFSGSRELMTIADECIELKNLCQHDKCKNPANFHLRYIDDVVDRSPIPIMIEKGNVTYKSLCRKHYMREMNINSRD